jgi:hypothetical protein
MTYNQQTNDEMSEQDKSHKIEMLRQMMLQAEKTMQSAKAMLLQLEGKKKTGRKRKVDEDAEGNVVEGTFDGQIMIGVDGRQYPVPANYASKSKLVEGDLLKLTITPDGSFVYKQIGPADRKSVIGIVSQDEKGNYFIFSEGKPYKVLLASVTYFKAEPGDEVVIMIPREIDSNWAAIENVLQKGHDVAMSMSRHMPQNEEIETPTKISKFPADGELDSWKEDLLDKPVAKNNYEDHAPLLGDPSKNNYEEKAPLSKDDFIDEWTSDIEELEKEIKAQQI